MSAGKWTKGLAAGCLESSALVMDQGDGHGYVVYRGSPPFTEADARLFGAAGDLVEALARLAELARYENRLDEMKAILLQGAGQAALRKAGAGE